MQEEPKKRKKSGGRTKGTPNKKTALAREIQQSNSEVLQKLVQDELPNVIAVLKNLRLKNPSTYLSHMANLMEYVQPKLARTEVRAEINTDIIIIPPEE